MKYKKLAAALITASLLTTNLAPLSCLAKDNKKSKNKLIKSQVTQYRFDYVNTDWWKNFDDDYLSEYIIKAIENNHDLKIATLKVEQYHQMTNLQICRVNYLLYQGGLLLLESASGSNKHKRSMGFSSQCVL